MNQKQRALAAGFLVIWIAQLIHYIDLLGRYASKGAHLTHPILFVAIESWMLGSGCVCCWLVFKILEDVD